MKAWKRSDLTAYVGLALAPALKAALRTAASTEGVSASEAARRALVEWLADRGHWPPPPEPAAPPRAAPLPLFEGSTP